MIEPSSKFKDTQKANDHDLLDPKATQCNQGALELHQAPVGDSPQEATRPHFWTFQKRSTGRAWSLVDLFGGDVIEAVKKWVCSAFLVLTCLVLVDFRMDLWWFNK